MNLKSIVSLLLIILTVGCGSALLHTAKDMPDWYLNTPDDETALYGVGESNGSDLGLTRQDAEAAARDEIARQLEIKISNMILRSKQAVGGDIDANVVKSASKQITNLSASHIKIVDKKVVQKGNKYVVYALAKMPIESVKEQTRKTLEQQEIRRQLDIDKTLQDQLNTEIENMDGTQE